MRSPGRAEPSRTEAELASRARHVRVVELLQRGSSCAASLLSAIHAGSRRSVPPAERESQACRRGAPGNCGPQWPGLDLDKRFTTCVPRPGVLMTRPSSRSTQLGEMADLGDFVEFLGNKAAYRR